MTTDDDHPLADLLALRQVDRDRFVGPTPQWVAAGDRRFGGAGLAQLLKAATMTVGTDRLPHALHAFFVGMGDAAAPIELTVEEVYDGGSFSVRHVKAAQEGRTRIVGTVSFTQHRGGGEFAAPIRSDAPSPTEDLAALGLGRSIHTRMHIGTPFEVIEAPTDELEPAGPYRTTRLIWVRAREPLGEDVSMHACALAYASDFGATIANRVVVGATLTTPGQWASLNHTLWFHRLPRMDRWNLVDFRPVSAAHSRGLVTAYVHTEDDVHVATMTQETMMRVADGAPPTLLDADPARAGEPTEGADA